MFSIAVVGAHGYVGSALCDALEAAGNGCSVTRVTRENYHAAQAASYDIVINAAMPSKRFWAKSNPSADFEETVKKTTDLFHEWSYKKFIQISSVSARCQLDTVYGQHKAAAERVCQAPQTLIVRLGPMYSRNLSKGVLIDILENKKVWLDGNSRYAFASLDFVSRWIATNLNFCGTVEVGARNSVSLKEVAMALKKDILFEGPADHQEIENPQTEFPDARDVFLFMEKMNSKKV